MKRPKRRIQITEYDFFTLSPKEKGVYHAILKETILKNNPCVQLSLNDLSEMTGIKRRRSSIKHLISTGEKISIGSGTSDKELLEMLNKTEKLDFMKNFNDK